ncbi:MAG: MBL fold metallo-hydrolase [Armatimonadota bacterium]
MSTEKPEPSPVRPGGPPRAGLIAAVLAVLTIGIVAVVSRPAPPPPTPANGPDRRAQSSHPQNSPGASSPGNAPVPATTDAPNGGAPANSPAGNRPVAPGTDPANGAQPPVAAERPATPPEGLPNDHPPLSTTGDAEVTLQWLGYSSFYIHSPGGVGVVTDPFDPAAAGIPSPEAGAHFVTVSSSDPRHSYEAGVRAFQDDTKQVLRAAQGTRGDLRITPVPTRGGNTAYVIEAGPLRLAHLGAPTQPPTDAELAALGKVDVLLLPVGEGLTPRQAVAISEQLKPPVVVPMAYSTPGMSGAAAKLRPVDDFIAASPYAVSRLASDVTLLARSRLPQSTEIWTLKYRR